jgi:hypothetical protein
MSKSCLTGNDAEEATMKLDEREKGRIDFYWRGFYPTAFDRRR